MEEETNDSVEEVVEETKDTTKTTNLESKVQELEQQLGSANRDRKKLQRDLDQKDTSKSETDTPKKSEEKDTPIEQPKSNKPDYSDLAIDTFLEGRNIKHDDSIKYVKDEAERLNMDVRNVLKEEHVTNRLKNMDDQRTAESGMP
ncbi:MAG: hypothetical protein IH948_02860, partial [Bacteroidetes bacterium]|nr:hypothetical protein [Bacteroidota bacterium]